MSIESLNKRETLVRYNSIRKSWTTNNEFY